jgi:MbtH protein
MSFDEEGALFNVVLNQERQYSIWPQWKAIPAGWEAVGVSGDKKTCLEHIEKVWTDMRPYSLQQRMKDSQPG